MTCIRTFFTRKYIKIIYCYLLSNIQILLPVAYEASSQKLEITSFHSCANLAASVLLLGETSSKRRARENPLSSGFSDGTKLALKAPGKD